MRNTTDKMIRPVISGLLHSLYPDAMFFQEVGASLYFPRQRPTYRDIVLDVLGIQPSFPIGIEIKSDKDSLVRFARQEPCYAKLCKENYLVIGEKFLTKLETIPYYWGIIVVYDGGDGLRAEIVREAQSSPHYEPDALLMLIWQDEMRMLLKKNGLYKGMSRVRLRYQRQRLKEHLDPEELMQEMHWTFSVRDNWKLAYKDIYPYDTNVNHIHFWEGLS